MAWNESLRRFWTDNREAAVSIGVDESLLRRVDAVIDDRSIIRSRSEWTHAFQTALRAVSEAMASAARSDPRAAAVMLEYGRRLGTRMGGFFERIEEELCTSLPSYLMEYVVRSQLSPAFLRTLFDGVPRWQDAMSEHLFIMREETSKEAIVRSTAEVIFDVAELTYKPLLWNLTRLVRERFGMRPAKEKFRTLGQIRGEFLGALIHPLEPIVGIIDDDAIFVRNGVGHRRRTLPFDPRTGLLTIEDEDRSQSFGGEDLIHVLHYLVRRTRAMWVVFYKCSGQMALERGETAWPPPAAAAP